MNRLSSLCICALAAFLVVPRAVEAAPRELVIANEAFVEAGTYLQANVDAFVRRVEEVAGWPANSLRGKGFAKPADALDYIRQHKVPFAILPIHQFVQARRELKLQPIGRAVGLDGTEPTYWGVSRGGKVPFEHIEQYPGLRLAMTEIKDVQWINILFEGNVRPLQHFKLVEVDTPRQALDAVQANKADVALLYETDFRAVKKRLGEGGDLAWVYAAGGMPPFPVLSVGKFAARADQKKLEGALTKICKGSGADACGRMAILYIEAGKAESYAPVIQKYDTYP